MIGFVGLGAMGAPISRALVEAGHELAVFDLNPSAPEGAVVCTSAREVADRAELVFASLPTPVAVRAVLSELLDGGAMRTFVDLSTTGASVTAELAREAEAAGVDYLEAPVSGGVAGAEARTLAVMASGDEAVFERVRPLLETFGGSVVYVGPEHGQGQLAKLLNNVLAATALVATSEVMAMGAEAGLDPSKLVEIFNAGSGQNSATVDKFPRHVLTGTYASGFRLALMRKDLGLCLEEAELRQRPMQVAELVHRLYTEAGEQLGPEADQTEIARYFE
jgi:3-hydroxyisobutyrate dehydrogenase-like beta-hydroxyacid dehydrogenase